MKVIKEEGDCVKVEVDVCEHLWIKTPRGEIKVYVGRHWASITSWVDDTNYAGFYTNNATKKTTPCNERVQHIELRAKED